MAKYQFTSVINGFKTAHTTASTGDEKAKKAHDKSVYDALMTPYKEVREFYTGYEKLLNEAKAQCKSNMDAIETTIKKANGHLSEQQLKLLKNSQQTIHGFVGALKSQGEVLRTQMMDWRSGWDTACAEVVFNRQPLDSFMGYRKQLIDQQSGVWNALAERVDQYGARADALLTAAAKTVGQDDSGPALAKLREAYTACVNAGPKGFRTYAENVSNELPKMKEEAKKGIDPRDKPNAAALWKAKKPKYDQMATYGKSFSGATKTLNMLLASLAAASKDVDKSQMAGWTKLKNEIEADQATLKTATGNFTEIPKLIEKLTAHYSKAISG